MDIWAILGWIVFGFVFGLLARAVVPGRQSMGFIKTTLLGIAGAFVGGFLGSLIHGEVALRATESWVGAFIGSIIALLIAMKLGSRSRA